MLNIQQSFPDFSNITAPLSKTLAGLARAARVARDANEQKIFGPLASLCEIQIF